MPPLSRNHLVPTGWDTPAPSAASSLDNPQAIASQNRRRVVPHGVTDDVSVFPSQLLTVEVLRRPFESTAQALLIPGMPVEADQHRHDRLVCQINSPGAEREAELPASPNRYDDAVVDKKRCVLDWLAAVARDQAGSFVEPGRARDGTSFVIGGRVAATTRRGGKKSQRGY